MILKFINGEMGKLLFPKFLAIYSQCFHQQIEVAAFISKDFMRIIREHETKLV